MNITRGTIKSAQRIVVYGPEGVGKSTFASRFPNAVFIDTEGSTKPLDVARFDPPTSWEMLMQEVGYVRSHPTEFNTLVIDTADWAEKLCIKKICDKAQKDGIEDFGWGKGYVYVQEEFGRLLNELEEVVHAGINVVIAAHAKMNKVEQPDEMGAYDRWELKLTKQTAPMLKEWADALFFANYKTIVVNTGDKKYKGQGGQQRIMYTTHTAAWDAKNRHSLPDVLPFDYNQIAHIVENTAPSQSSASASVPAIPTAKPAEPEQAVKASDPVTIEQLVGNCKEQGIPVEVVNHTQAAPSIPDYVPKALADLMRAKSMTVEDIETIVEKRGYFPPGTSLRNYPPDFVEGCLIAAWEQLYKYAVDNGLVDLPF